MAVMKQFAQPTPTAMGKSSTDAPTHITNGWHEVTRKVRRLQARIVKVTKTVEFNRIETVSVKGH